MNMFDSYLNLAANTFFSNLIFPISQEYVAIVMLSAMVSYNKIIMAIIIFIFTFLAFLFNMLIGLACYNSFNKFINNQGLKNIEYSKTVFFKYCLYVIPLLAFVSPILLIVVSTFCGFLKLFKKRIFLAFSFEIATNIFKLLHH